MEVKFKTRSNNIKYYQLLKEIAELYESKDSDYSYDVPLSNFRRCEVIGIKPWEGVLVRMMDKWSRIVNLVRKKRMGINPAVKEDKLRSELLDNAVYSLIAVIFLDEDAEVNTV